MGAAQAFICYRRTDTFLTTDQSTTDEGNFITRVTKALNQLGFAKVFVDVDQRYGIESSEHWESVCFKEIEASDIFVILVGKRWSRLLVEKVKSDKRDASAREIRTALSYEKKILPVLVDGATMPSLEQLPQQLRRFHYQHAVSLNSSDRVDTIKTIFQKAADDVGELRKHARIWKSAYIHLAVISYILCAIVPNYFGWHEYGQESWLGISKIWGGLFIWPVFFLPFVLAGLFRPLSTIVESVFKSKSIATSMFYIMPVVLGTLLSTAAWFVEVMDPRQAPWNISPEPFLAYCTPNSKKLSFQKTDVSALSQERDNILATLSTYNGNAALPNSYKEKNTSVFWADNKCWPNSLFYLTVPLYENVDSQSYNQDRGKVQAAFTQILDDKIRQKINVPLSATSTAYRVSIGILIWIGINGIVLAVFYTIAKIRDPKTDLVRSLPVDDAFMSLTYCLATLMTWIPFRMHTEYIKYLYSCDNPSKCMIDVRYYMPDILLTVMLIIGYIFATTGLLAKFRRIALSFLGLTTVLLCLSGATAAYYFRESVAKLAEFWQFYLVISIPFVSIVFALWLLFDPVRVHYNDFRKDVY